MLSFPKPVSTRWQAYPIHRQVSSQNRTRHGRLRERRLACPAPKARSEHSSPRFRHAQVSQRCCHARIHRRRPESGSRSAAKGARELRQGPMRSRHLCPLGSGPGDHEIPELHRAITRAGALLGGRRQSRQRRTRTTSYCAASASGSAATTIARTFSRRALPFILRGRSTRCWLSLRRAFRDRTASRIGRRSRHSPPPIPKRCIRRTTSPRIRCPASFAGTTYWGVHAFPATNSKGETRFIKFKVVPVGEDSQAGRERGHDEACRLPARRPRNPDRGPRYPVQRDGAARPSRRPHHGRHHPMAG